MILLLSIQNHFLDTNMILSIAFEDSNFNDCRNYYKLHYKRYISYNVKNEVLRVIERKRLIASNILYYIKDYMSLKSIDLVNLDFHMKIIQKNYLNQFKDESYIFNINKDRFLKIVGDLFVEYYDKVKDAIINNDIELESLSSELRDAFKKYNESVIRCLTNFEKFSFENNTIIIDKLINIGIHEKDAILIDDCYNKAKNMNKKFVLVTNDNNIIKRSQFALELLDSKIHFAKPSDFLNN